MQNCAATLLPLLLPVPWAVLLWGLPLAHKGEGTHLSPHLLTSRLSTVSAQRLNLPFHYPVTKIGTTGSTTEPLLRRRPSAEPPPRFQGQCPQGAPAGRAAGLQLPPPFPRWRRALACRCGSATRRSSGSTWRSRRPCRYHRAGTASLRVSAARAAGRPPPCEGNLGRAEPSRVMLAARPR